MSQRLKLPFKAIGLTMFPSSAFFLRIVPVTGATDRAIVQPPLGFDDVGLGLRQLGLGDFDSLLTAGRAA